MLMAVDVDGGCWEVVVVGVWWFRRWNQCLPRIVFKQMPLRHVHMPAKISRRRMTTPSDNPMSKWSMNDTWEEIPNTLSPIFSGLGLHIRFSL